jgi:hypothetical protein
MIEQYKSHYRPGDILDIINNVLNVDPDKLKKSQNDGSATNRYANV